MQLAEALKVMRKEVGLTQVELAKALGVYSTSVSRWEAGKTVPQSRMMGNIIAIAASKGASELCLKHLRLALNKGHKEVVRVPNSSLYPVERSSLCQLVDDADNGVFVVDRETDEVLYANAKAEEFFGQKFMAGMGQKCMEFVGDIFGMSSKCTQEYMQDSEVKDVHVKHMYKNQYFHMKGRTIKWNGRPAYVQYVTDETDALEAQGGLKELLDNIDVGICIWYMYNDGHLERSFSNAKYCEILGLEPNESRSYVKFEDFYVISPKDREVIKKKALTAVKLERDFDFTVQLTVPERACKWVNLHGRFLGRDKERIKYSCVLIDLDALGK